LNRARRPNPPEFAHSIFGIALMLRTPHILGFLVVVSLSACADDEPSRVDFNSDIRPILSENCYQCHGPDANRRKGKLRLDAKEDAFRDRSGHAVIVAGKPDESEIVARICETDDATRMPPPGSGKPLSKAQVETIRRWISQGAEWKGHWAFETPARTRVPKGDNSFTAFIRNDIDRFILAKLRERGLTPAPEADKVSLIRRLTFDLTGLPPTPSETRAFLTDRHGDAYERLVDRLLSSPKYGERMAMAWLDLVRYADTTGFHSDTHRDIWMFRDYVIQSFNDNKPFDQFTVEQLAGDLLPGPAEVHKIASGYNRLLMTTQEGGAQPKEYAAKYMADRVRNVSSVWMGLTLGCAECHDHKFDPLTTKDFYSLASFFADVKETPVGVQEQTRVPTPAQASEEKEIQSRITATQATLDRQTPELDREQAEWERSLADRRIEWQCVTPESARSSARTELLVLDDQSILANGAAAEKDTYTVVLPRDTFNTMTGLRIEVLPHESLPKNGPGRASNGNFVIQEIELSVGGKRISFDRATASHEQDHYPIARALDGNRETGWAIDSESGQANEAVFELPTELPSGNDPPTLTLRQEQGAQRLLGRFRISITSSRRPIRVEGVRGVPKSIRAYLENKPADRNRAQIAEIAAYHRSIAASLDPARNQLSTLQKELEALRAKMPKTLITQTTAPAAMRVLPRGNWLDDSGAPVEPAVPAAVSPGLKLDRRATRHDLANWLVAPENPLVSRVIVNRLWKIAFGQGLVATPDDFGSQGALPTHPHLLDWLAAEFRESGWDVKKMLRLLVTSGTYRQSSATSAALRATDPGNAWLARQARYRLDAEMVRDNALAISGLLVEKVGGPSARPYQPAGYWSHLNFPKREYQPDQGEGLYRRGLYTYWCRTFLHPSLLAFDAPTREECQVQRPRSNTPLQALVLLNDPTYVEAARAFAERILREGGTNDGERIRFAMRWAVTREARPAEIEKLLTLLRDHRAHFQADRAAAKQLISVGERPAPANLDDAELAAWASVARVVLNLHETITRN
jgi:hypothetical protein